MGARRSTWPHLKTAVRLDLPFFLTARSPIRLFRLVLESWKGPGADSEEKREPARDIDTAAVDSLKVLDPKRQIDAAAWRQELR
jgi:hypothetical protein